MAEILGPRPAAVARELTKLHEEVRRGTLAALAEHYRECRAAARRDGRRRRPARTAAGRPTRTRSTGGCARRSPSSACATRAAKLAAETGLPRSALYRRALAIRERTPMRRGRARYTTARRQRAERRGRLAEWLCLWHLRLRGWHIVARGWRCPAGEIDIVARRGKVLAIVEVKSRGEVAVAADALSPRQRRRIARAAEALLVSRPDLAGIWMCDST